MNLQKEADAMTSRERMRKVLNHEIPDRVPNGLGGCETAGLHVVSYDTVQKIFNIPPQPPRIDTFMTNAVFELPLIRAMEGDILLIASPHMCRAPLRGAKAPGQWKEQELWGRTFRVPAGERFKTLDNGSISWETTGSVSPAGTFYFDWPGGSDLYADFQYPDPDDYNPPDSFTEEFLRVLEETAKTLYEETGYCLSLGETVTDLQYKPRGMLGGMVLVQENPDLMRAYLAKATDASLKQIALLEQAVGKYVDILNIADDIGDNRGVIIGDALWRDIYKPFYKKLFQGWHERTGMKINLHSCGSIYTILDDLIECGLDMYNPVQISAQNMDGEKLKAKAGKNLVFYGGDYDAQLMQGRDYGEVYEHVKGNIRTFKRDGGHVFAGVHNLPPDMSEEHLRAFFTAWMDTRDY
jgi:uroporphyrinogen decarboxylase